jgi:hypothetical protein
MQIQRLRLKQSIGLEVRVTQVCGTVGAGNLTKAEGTRRAFKLSSLGTLLQEVYSLTSVKDFNLMLGATFSQMRELDCTGLWGWSSCSGNLKTGTEVTGI